MTNGSNDEARARHAIDEIWAAVDGIRYKAHSWEEAEEALQEIYIALATFREGDDAGEPPIKESFQDAVRTDPDMTPEQKAKWLVAS